jgi:hypothetical protein
VAPSGRMVQQHQVMATGSRGSSGSGAQEIIRSVNVILFRSLVVRAEAAARTPQPTANTSYKCENTQIRVAGSGIGPAGAPDIMETTGVEVAAAFKIFHLLLFTKALDTFKPAHWRREEASAILRLLPPGSSPPSSPRTGSKRWRRWRSCCGTGRGTSAGRRSCFRAGASW